MTLLEQKELNKMSFLCDQIKKRIPELQYSELWEKAGELTLRQYRVFLAVMSQKPHMFKNYVFKNLIHNSNPF